MSKLHAFEGVTLVYSSAPHNVKWEGQPCIITCKCGQTSMRSNGYMKDVCQEVSCPSCGHKASRNSDTLRTDEK